MLEEVSLAEKMIAVAINFEVHFVLLAEIMGCYPLPRLTYGRVLIAMGIIYLYHQA
jgi:hypothetical protein